MPAINYANLGLDRKLNEIVMAGSHDAGITSGAANVMTQSLDIGGQAAAGVRIFDLRIAAFASGTRAGGVKEVRLQAYHGSLKNETKTRRLEGLRNSESLTRSKMKLGDVGEGLDGMLAQAAGFVRNNPSEFLLLKFDKCTNWGLIADSCVRLLGDTIYRGIGSLNTKTLRELAGKVVPLFTTQGLAEVRSGFPPGSGILGISNLASGGSYDPNYNGLQYFGKGGTSVTRPFGKIGQNLGKQTDLMQCAAAACDPAVMGMMYWTSTGIFESIRKRNDRMWNDTNVASLNRMWTNGLSDAIESRIATSVDPATYAAGSLLKAFMPNIVMIDFADPGKCQHIYGLNHVAATALTDAARAVERDVGVARRAYAQLQQNTRQRLP